jgi:hypothetical protein
MEFGSCVILQRKERHADPESESNPGPTTLHPNPGKSGYGSRALSNYFQIKAFLYSTTNKCRKQVIHTTVLVHYKITSLTALKCLFYNTNA